MADVDHEQRVRAACFVAIGQMQQVHGDVLPVEVIQRGVVIEGERIALVNPYKGIHKPRQLDAALAVTTTPPTSTKDAPYDDRMGDDGLYVYHYRTAGSDSRRAHQQAERDNASVRFAKDKGLELIYWHGVVPGQYLPFFPVRVVGEDAAFRTFSLDLTGLARHHCRMWRPTRHRAATAVRSSPCGCTRQGSAPRCCGRMPARAPSSADRSRSAGAVSGAPVPEARRAARREDDVSSGSSRGRVTRVHTR